MRRKPGPLVPLETAICVSAANLRRSGATEFHGYEIAKRLGSEKGRRLYVLIAAGEIAAQEARQIAGETIRTQAARRPVPA